MVVSTVDNCERSFGILADWRHFRREFAEFSNRLRGQQIVLRQHIEFALRSITDSEAQLIAMMEEPGGASWQTSVLAARLRVKLSGAGEFDTYCCTLDTVHAQLKKLDKRLEVHGSIVSVAYDQIHNILLTWVEQSHYGNIKDQYPKGISQAPILFSEEKAFRAGLYHR